MGRKNKKVAPTPSEEGDEFEKDPPITCTDDCIFMPILVSEGVKSTLLEDKNFVRSFTMDGKVGKIKPKEFVTSMMISPEHFNLPFENIFLKAKDGVTLNAFLVRLDKDREKVPTIILFHGNSGNIGDNITWAVAMFEEILCNIFMLDYRGYGYSEGVPSERGAYWDAQAAFDFVYSRPDLNKDLIVLHGQSIGGAIALDLAVRKKYRSRVAGLIIENTFTSLNLLLHHYSKRCCLRPVRLLFKCFCIEGKDNVIPPSHSSCLFDISKSSRKRFYVDAQAEHMNAYVKDSYYQEIGRFLVEVMLHQEENSHKLSDPFSNAVRKSRNEINLHVKRISD